MSDAMDQADELVAAMDHTFGPDGADRRGAPRTLHEAPLVITPLADEICQEPAIVALQDFSTIGVGFTHNQPLVAESQFLIRLPGGDQGPVEVLCTVRNCRLVDPGQFRIGAEFTRLLNREQPADTARPRLQWLSKSTFAPRVALSA